MIKPGLNPFHPEKAVKEVSSRDPERASLSFLALSRKNSVPYQMNHIIWTISYGPYNMDHIK